MEPNWDEYEDVYVSERTSLKDRKRTYVRKCTSDVHNHFLRPIYKRPKILSNRIITASNLGTFGLIRRKGAFHFFRIGPNWDEYEDVYVSERTSLKYRKQTYVQKCTSDVRNHFLRPILQTSRDSFKSDHIRTKSRDVRLNSPKSDVFVVNCRHGGRGKYFGRFVSCPHRGRGKYFGRFF